MSEEVKEEFKAVEKLASEKTESAKAEAQPHKEPSEPKWLPERLERERVSVLKQLGVDNIDDAKTALQELKKIQDSQKSEVERLREQLREYETAKSELASYKKSVSERAADEVAKLTPEQREAVMALAGDNPAAQMTAINKLRPTWKVESESFSKPLATTSPNPSAPKETISSERSKPEEYAELKEKNPLLAAHMLLQHRDQILQHK